MSKTIDSERYGDRCHRPLIPLVTRIAQRSNLFGGCGEISNNFIIGMKCMSCTYLSTTNPQWPHTRRTIPLLIPENANLNSSVCQRESRGTTKVFSPLPNDEPIPQQNCNRKITRLQFFNNLHPSSALSGYLPRVIDYSFYKWKLK